MYSELSIVYLHWDTMGGYDIYWWILHEIQHPLVAMGVKYSLGGALFTSKCVWGTIFTRIQNSLWHRKFLRGQDCNCNYTRIFERERLSSPRSMLRYIILLNIHKGIGRKFRVAWLLYFDLNYWLCLLCKAHSQLFYSSSQGIQQVYQCIRSHKS